MAPLARITPESFITFTSPADMVGDEYRTAMASYASRFARQKKSNLSDSERRKTNRSFFAWRANDCRKLWAAKRGQRQNQDVRAAMPFISCQHDPTHQSRNPRNPRDELSTI